MPFLIFDLISLLYLLNSFRVLARLIRNWRGFWDSNVTAEDLALASQVAFFVLIPLGVFLHEAGHALATWQVGGEVASFQWRVFWGYIVSQGSFTPAQDWWIAFSGNLVSVLLGLLAIPLIGRASRRIHGELLYAFAKQQLFYALIWYPALTFLGLAGDWAKIYDFSIIPYAQVTLVLHLALLYGLWRADNGPAAARWRVARRPERFAELLALEAADGKPAALAELAYFYHRVGERRMSQAYQRQAEAADSSGRQVNVLGAVMAYERKNYRQAQEAARAALMTDLSQADMLRMHKVLALALMQEGRREEALSHFDTALRLARNDFQLYYWRAVLQRSMGRRDEARSDMERALMLAPDEDSRAQVQRELEGT